MFKKMLKKGLGKLAHAGLEETITYVTDTRFAVMNTQLQQKQLQVHYQNLIEQKRRLPHFQDAGWRIFSQTDEDGILHFIFSVIGTRNRVCFDIAHASPDGANTTNLILNQGWTAILVCAEDSEVEAANRFFLSHKDSRIFPPYVMKKWITRENINAIVKEGLEHFRLDTKEIDLLSLDIDGMDYWIWKELDAVQPRVIVVEYQDSCGEQSVTVPYKPDFDRADIDPEYFGASIAALVKLAKEKGYRLVGCNRLGYNAFFVKSGIADDLLPEISIHECLNHPKNRLELGKWDKLKQYEWTEV